MNWWIPRCVGLVCACAVGAVVTPVAARAQIGNAVNPIDNPGGLLEQGARMAPQTSVPHNPLPPALPGATSRPGSAAPATRIPADMSPNDALFDAINRGDVAAARDAMSRGADLNARNVLGMTPMELSVDLGRNDISFLLLSYRGGSEGGGGPAQAADQRAAPAAARLLAGKRSRGPAHPTRTASRRRAPVARAEPRVAAPQKPRLFANDGGAPVPSAGFVGFGSGGR